MILIDTISKSNNLPCSYRALDFWIDTIEYRDNEHNEAVSEQMRQEVTRREYVLTATVVSFGDEIPCPLCTKDTKEGAEAEAETMAIYNDIMAAIKRGDAVYSFREKSF